MYSVENFSHIFQNFIEHTVSICMSLTRKNLPHVLKLDFLGDTKKKRFKKNHKNHKTIYSEDGGGGIKIKKS